MEAKNEFLYRYVTKDNLALKEIIISEEDVYIAIERFVILRRTKCGAWINVYGKNKFVNLWAKKQFASETRELARTGFIARRKVLLSILEQNIIQSKKELEALKDSER
ncbi:MAG: hypothetical protein WC856_07895 [Methylococcaceae bacterium]|jgi:hypothetical protein